MRLHQMSNMKVSLVHCPLGSPQNIPLALPCLAAYLKAYGYEVECWDLNLSLWKELEARQLLEIGKWQGLNVDLQMKVLLRGVSRNWAEMILASNPSVVGLSVNIVNVYSSMTLAAALKEITSSIKIVFGGPECIPSYSKLLKYASVDYIVLGDGEYPLLALLRFLEGKINDERIAGVASKTNSKNIIPAVNLDLDVLPFPDFSTVNIQKYGNFKEECELPIYTSTGCTINCTFCSRRLLSGSYRCKSPERIIEEIKYLVKNYKIKRFCFVDSLINGNLQVLRNWTSGLKEQGTTISWRANAVFSPHMNKELLDLLYQAGCTRLSYGLESASPKVLKNMRKYSDIKMIESIIYNTHNAGISVTCFVIVGYPTETIEDFELTIDFLLRNKDFIQSVQVSSCYIIPGTYLSMYKLEFDITGDADGWKNQIVNDAERTLRVETIKSILSRNGILESNP